MQKIFLNYRQDDSTFDLTRKLAGVLPEGVYQGLDFQATADLNLTLTQTNGKQYLLADGATLSNKYGVAINKQGSVFITDETYSLPITAPSSNPRIDLVVLTHKYVEVEGGNAPVVSVIQGSEAAVPTAPALTLTNEQIELGQIYLPAGITALTDSGVSYTKNDATLYNQQNFDGSQFASFDTVEQIESDLADLIQQIAITNYAFTDQENEFTKTQKLAKGATQLTIDGSNLVTISTFDGNFYRIGAGELSGITAVREGTTLKFRVIGASGLLLKHNQTVSSPHKKLLISGAQDIFLQENDVFTLVEDSDGWIVEGLPVSHRVPVGKYVELFTGTPAEIPTTHYLCDGSTQNGIVLPDLRSSFVVGYNPSETDYDAVGKTGGAKEVTLTEAQTPVKSHNHDIKLSYYLADSATFTLGDAQLEILNTEPDDTVNTHTATTESTNDATATAHENRPPYYTVAYIMRIK